MDIKTEIMDKCFRGFQLLFCLNSVSNKIAQLTAMIGMVTRIHSAIT